MKTAIVTGGAGSLGKAICKKLASDGFIVYMTDISEERCLDAIKETHLENVRAKKLDVTEEADWIAVYDDVMSEEGSVDVVVNNAGVNIRFDIEECSVENWDRMFQINVRSIFLSIKHALPIMKAQGGGSIINISSVCGLVGHRYTNESYTATKGAVTLLTKSVAARYGKFNIRCNSVHPSTVKTELVNNFLSDPERMKERVEEVPLGHLATPADVAAAVSFLASDEAAFINGVQLPVDGGTSCD